MIKDVKTMFRGMAVIASVFVFITLFGMATGFGFVMAATWIFFGMLAAGVSYLVGLIYETMTGKK